MQENYILIVIMIVLPILFYFLWLNGYMTENVKRALLYIGKCGKILGMHKSVVVPDM